MPAGRGKLASLTSRLTECKSRAGTSTQVRKRAHINGRNDDMGNWQAWNDGTGKRKWFLARVVDGITEYHWAKPRKGCSVALVRYASYKTACKAAVRLNEATP